MSDLSTKRHSLLFDVRRSVRYHNRRRAFFERLGHIKDAMSVIFGSAVIYGVLKEAELQGLAVLSAVLVTILSGVDLVIGSSRMANLHHDLARRFIVLEKSLSMVEAEDVTSEDVHKWTGSRLDIEAEEPPIFRVLDAMCHNELLRAEGYKSGFVRIGFMQRLFAHIYDFSPDSLVSSDDNAPEETPSPPDSSPNEERYRLD